MKKIPLIQTSVAAIFWLLFIAPAAVWAQDAPQPAERHERWYQVEMIIFSRSESNAQHETWPKNIKLAYPNNMMRLSATGTGTDAFTMLSSNERLLNVQAATIANSGSYSLLFHQAWRQMITAKRTSVLITGGKNVNGHQPLEGSVDLSVGQFLKLKTNLWLTQFSLSPPTETNSGWPDLPQLTNTDVRNTQEDVNYTINRIVKISQQRSMRSVEVHYIDHPLLGIIIKIIPYDAASQATVQ